MSNNNVEDVSAKLAGSPRFAQFSITDFTYKTVRDTAVEASILVPKSILDSSAGKRPLAVRWHGGFLVAGHRLFAEWYPQFVLDLCLKHDAVAITVDYRLMPEASGAEIIKDVDDFYAWLRAPGNLAAHLPAGVEVDLENLLVTGESAGGYLTFHSALLASAEVKVIVLHYPMLDLRDPHYTTAYYKPLFDPPVPPIPPKVLEDHVAGLNGTEVVTNAVPMDRMPIVLSMGLEGRFGDFLGDERSLYPLEVLEDGWTSKPALPPTWILHGKQDLAVPIEGTHRFVERLQAHAATTPLHLTYEDGQHGFDEVTSSDTMWVKEGVQFIEKYWPVNAP